MPEICSDCKAEIVFDPMKKRTRFSCEICDRPLCAACGVIENDGRTFRLPCRRCKSSNALTQDQKD